MPTKFYVSPFGEAEHPWLSKADVKYNPDGLFHTGLVLEPGPETDEFVALVTQASEAAFEEEAEKLTAGERKKFSLYVPVKPEEDAEGNPTGRHVASFKQNRLLKFKDGTTKEITIAIKDASGRRDVHKPVFGGSIIRVMFSMRTAKIVSSKEIGVRLDFASVQVKKLATSGGGKSFGSTDGYHEDELDERDMAAFDPADDRRVTGDY